MKRKNPRVLSMLKSLRRGNRVAIAGCKDPEKVIKELLDYGMSVTASPMTTFHLGQDEITGYIFQKTINN